MSYDIIYDRKFIDVGDGTYIPFALYGCNNVTESCVDSRGRHYEKRVRGWHSMTYSCFGDRTRLSFTKEEMVSSLRKMFEEEGRYCSSTKYNGKFFTPTSEINFFENGCKNASLIEDIIGHCWGISIDVKAYNKGSYDSRDVFSSCPRTTEELKLALEQARMAAKVNAVGDTICYVSMKSYSSSPIPKLGASRRRSSVVNAEIKKNTHYVIKLENGSYFVKRSAVRYWYSGWESAAKAFRTQKEAERYLSKAPFDGTVVEVEVK